MNGFLVVNKPLGKTSSNCVVFVRKRLPRGTSIGHGGTLDPDASGVLPICIGSATRLFDYIIDKKKTYVAELQLGIETDTQDASGTIVAEHSVSATQEDLCAALPRFIGQIEQVPPMYSAIKRNGRRLYEMARKGETIALEARSCRVDDIRFTGCTAPNRYRLEIDCGKGVYIRTLCHDIGRMLGCGGHMATLARVRAGIFSLEEALTLEDIEALDPEELAARLILPDRAIQHLPAVRVDESHLFAVRNGNPLRPAWLPEPAPDAPSVRVYVGDAFAGIGEPRPDGSVRFRAMLLADETKL